MTPGTFLQQYASERDAEAFSRIVEEYQRFVLATCRRRLHDPSDVDDAVQETFLRLAKKADELKSNVGGWLHRCAVNVSTDLNRRRAARRQHEHAAAEHRPISTPDLQQELSELREHLDAALEKIDAEQRELIIQRFFVGRQQIDIAAAEGVAASTITHRLGAAIAALRAQLDAMGCHAVAAGAATSVLVDAMQAEASSAVISKALTANLMKIGLTGAASNAAGVATMMTTTKLVISAAAIIAAVLVGAWQLYPASSQPAPSTQPTLLSQTPAQPGPSSQPNIVPTFTVRSDQNADATIGPRWEPSTQSATMPAGVLSGRITDAAGRPVGDGTITLRGTSSASARIAPDGSYSIPSISRDGQYRIGVTAEGFMSIAPYITQLPAIQLTRNSHERRDIVMERGVPVEVTVIGAEATPIEGADVDLSIPGARDNALRRAKTTKDGIAKFVVHAGQSFTVGVSAPNYAPSRGTVITESPDKPVALKVHMEIGFAVSGVAICKDGLPAAGWTIYALPDWWISGYYPKPAEIDADGKFALFDVGTGKYDLFLSVPQGGGMSSMEKAGSIMMPPEHEPIRAEIAVVSPASRSRVVGRVRFDGRRTDDVEIAMQRESGGSDYRMLNLRDGRALSGTQRANRDEYVFENVPKGIYRLTFSGPGIESLTLKNVEIPGDVPLADLKVIGRLTLTGTVTDRDTGKPIEHFAVRVRKIQTLGAGPNYAQETQWSQVNHVDGRFSVDLVSSGIYQAQVSANGYAWTWTPEIRIEQGTSNCAVALSRGGSLEGTIQDPAGNPVAGAKVIPFSMARSVAMGSSDRFDGDAGSVTADPVGRFMLSHLAAGSETLKVVHPDFAPLISDKFPVVDSQLTDAGTTRLKVGGAVEGTIFDNSGQPMPGQVIQFQDTYSGGDDMAQRVATASSDAFGRFRVEHLPEMTLWVNLAERWKTGGVARRVVRPADGRTARLDFGGLTELKGRLLFGSKPRAGDRVVVSSDSPHFGAIMGITESDSTGNFSIRGMPPGHYRLFRVPATDSSTPILVRKIDISGLPVSLGDIETDFGDVFIKLNAEDPEILKEIRSVYVESFVPGRMYGEQVARAAPVPSASGAWRAANVSPGRYRVSVGLAQSDYSLSPIFERSAERTAEQTVAIDIFKPTATLKLQFDSAPTTDAAAYAVVANEDRSIVASVSMADPKPLRLPPGTYRIVGATWNLDRRDVDPVILKSGQTSSVLVPRAPRVSSAATERILAVYDANGVYIAGVAPRVFSAEGKEMQPEAVPSMGTVYRLAAGMYSARIEVEGKAPIEKNFAVVENEPDSPPWGSEPQMIHLFMTD